MLAWLLEKASGFPSGVASGNRIQYSDARFAVFRSHTDDSRWLVLVSLLVFVEWLHEASDCSSESRHCGLPVREDAGAMSPEFRQRNRACGKESSAKYVVSFPLYRWKVF